MIAVFPALVSNNVSINTIPGVIKILERYLIILYEDEIVNAFGRRLDIDRYAKMWRLKENTDIIREDKSIDSSEWFTSDESFDTEILLENDDIIVEQPIDKGPTKGKTSEERRRIEELEVELFKKHKEVEELQKKIEDMEKPKTSPKKRESDKKYREKRKKEQAELVARKEQLEKEIERLRDELHGATIGKKEQDVLDLRKRGWDPKEISKATGMSKKEVESVLKEKGDPKRPIKVDFSKVDLQSISLEPTWVRVSLGGEEVGAVGIKVVPFPVKSDLTLAELMMSDYTSKGLDVLLKKVSRNIVKVTWRFIYKYIPLIGRKTVTGDPRKDIVYQKSVFRDGVFCIINANDLSEDFFSSAGGVSKLFSLGWKSVVALDDVKKQAYFCMKQFKGICNVIPYVYMFSTLKQKDVFDSLEEVKRASTPFFRMKVPMSKLFESIDINNKESLVMKNTKVIQDFLERVYNSEKEVVTESPVSSFVDKINENTLKRLVLQVEKGVKRKDAKGVEKILKFVPNFSLTEIEKYCKKKEPNFPKVYDYVKKVVRNSLPEELPDEVSDSFSCAIAVVSSLNKSDPMGEAKKKLKDLIPKLRFKLESGDWIPATVLITVAGITISLVTMTVFSHLWIVAIILAIIALISRTALQIRKLR